MAAVDVRPRFGGAFLLRDARYSHSSDRSSSLQNAWAVTVQTPRWRGRKGMAQAMPMENADRHE